MLKLILIGLALAIAAVLVLAATRPDHFRIQRSARIQAPPERIFPLIDRLASHAQWLPYYRKDPAMQLRHSGPERGVGAASDFDGNKEVGSGRISITGSQPSERVTMRLQMFKPFAADNVVEFTLLPRGDSTEVTWAMQGHCSYPAKLMHLFFDMDRMIGRDFEAGLANLKALSET